MVPNILGNLRLRSKMLLLVSVPFAAVLWFAWALISQIDAEKQQATRFENLSALALHSSALVHEMQKERGASAGFLSSNGKAFSATLKQQRLLTDIQLKAFTAFERTFDETAFNNAFESNLSRLETLLNKLSDIRSRVSALNISVADEVAYYTDINTKLLDVSDNLARYSPSGSIANSGAAFATFLQSKERAGIERAVISSVFAKDSFTQATLNKFSDLVNTQNIYLSVFNNMASKEEIDFFNEQMNHQSVKEVERMRRVAFENSSTGDFGIDPELWFSTITQKINLLKNVENYLGQKLYNSAEEMEKNAVSEYWQTIGILVTSVLLSLLLVILIARSVDSSVSKAVKLAKAIASGNLTTRHTSVNRDETGQLLDTLNSMQDELTRVIGTSKSISGSVAAGARQISESSATLRKRTDDQASSLEQTASSTEEISSTIKRNAEFASEARTLAESASVEAEHGGEVVSRAVKAMSEINVASKKIASITGVIDEIAFQTNLLALNAAVEAARAGEQGRGFAVVASEVRSLAGRSAEAAKEIKQLIEDSVGKVESGAEYVDESGNALEQIVKSVKKVNEIISDIATASQEQSMGVDTINQSMVNMNKITRDNTTIAKDATSAGQDMAEQAAALSSNLDFFHLDKNT